MSETPSEESPETTGRTTGQTAGESAQEMAPEGAGASLARTAKIAVLLMVAIVGGIAAWIWVSSSEDANLPFEYEGFD